MGFKLYYTPTSCGAASFITAYLCDLKFESEQIDQQTKKTASGSDYLSINTKGNVPCVVLRDGTVLNENVATLIYIAEQNRDANLIPRSATSAYYVFLNALGFIASELQPAFVKLFNKALDEDSRQDAKTSAIRSAQRFVDCILQNQNFIVGGDSVTAADVYAYIIFSWIPALQIDLSEDHPAMQYCRRVANFPGIADARKKINLESNKS